MTENRFEFFKDGDEVYCRDVLDDFNYPMYDESTAKDIVNFMNFLYDEKNEVSRNFYRFYKNDYCNLEEESEQLKQEMGDLRTAHAEEITKIEDEFDKENLRLIKEIKQLKADNNRLVNETARIVAEHQGRVLDLIDKRIDKCEPIDYARNIEGDVPVFDCETATEIRVLNELKKELEDD